MNHKNIKISSNKSFGIVFAIVFGIFAFWPLLQENDIRIWSLIIALIFFILGILNSKILTPLNKIWFKFGIMLGSFISPLLMGIIFFVIVTPIGFLMKILKKDLLNLKFNKEKTYWLKKNELKSKMKDQF